MHSFRSCLLLSWLLVGLISAVWGQEKTHVLLLNSYHYGMDWTDGETAGVREALEKSRRSIELHVEYMDTKRLADGTHFRNLRQLLEYKYRNTRFAAILVTDNDAFDFLRRYRNDQIFAGVPVIFAGVNFFHADMLTGLSGFTGVAETFDGGQTIGVMQQFHPDVRRIVVVIDATTTGTAIRQELEPMLKAYSGKIDFEFWDNLSLEQMRARLPSLDKGTLVLLMPFARDNAGTFIAYSDMADMVSRLSPVPIYGTYDFYMGHGIVGGRLTRAVAQGRAAADILLRVLSGEDANRIPVTTVSPSEFQFDSRQLHRYGITTSALPPGSRLLFQSWYELYRTWVWLGGSLVIIALFLGWGWGRTYLLKRRSDLALRKSEERYGLILQNSPAGILHYDNELTITYCNERLAQILQVPREKLIGLDMKTLKDQRGLPALRAAIDGKEGAYEGEYVSTHSGAHIWASVSSAPDHGTDGQDGGIAIIEDITERKKVEAELESYRQHLEAMVQQRTKALLETETRASHILASTADGLYGVDSDGIITFINHAACEMLGYSAEQVIGRSAHSLFHHSKPDGSPYSDKECPSHGALRLGQTVRVDQEVYWHADGHAVPVMYAVHPMRQDDKVTGAVVSFVDISEQRAATQAREQALIVAENLARVRSEFLANISHEIRTPLNGVLGYAEIGYRKYQDGERARTAFENILVSGKRLLGVINDILDFSRIDVGKLSINATEVRLAEVIDHVVELVCEHARAKQITLQVVLAPDLPQTCISDPLRMGQVLLNLLSNAVKFTESGSVILSVSRQGDQLVFRVTDSGIGMTEDQLGQLFNPFQQADGSTTRRFGGMGLGLAISKRILELMGGDIHVESQPGEGSSFEFRLPYVQSGIPPVEPSPGLVEGT